MILEERPTKLVKEFINTYVDLQDYPFDKDKVYELIRGGNRKSWPEILTKLEKQWYKNDCKDFSGYDDDWYFMELWLCFVMYSRMYLKAFSKPQIIGKDKIYSLMERTKDSKCILDLGCGIGYTTAALKEMYPNAKVTGTNLKDTKQWKFCQHMSNKHNFDLVTDVSELTDDQDVIFASEYFEHIENPIEHLQEILNLNPKILVLANSFNRPALGHFTEYKHNDETVDQTKISKLFNDYLKKNGYEKLKTKFWNNRPNVWGKNNEPTVYDSLGDKQ